MQLFEVEISNRVTKKSFSKKYKNSEVSEWQLIRFGKK